MPKTRPFGPYHLKQQNSINAHWLILCYGLFLIPAVVSSEVDYTLCWKVMDKLRNERRGGFAPLANYQKMRESIITINNRTVTLRHFPPPAAPPVATADGTGYEQGIFQKNDLDEMVYYNIRYNQSGEIEKITRGEGCVWHLYDNPTGKVPPANTPALVKTSNGIRYFTNPWGSEQLNEKQSALLSAEKFDGRPHHFSPEICNQLPENMSLTDGEYWQQTFEFKTVDNQCIPITAYIGLPPAVRSEVFNTLRCAKLWDYYRFDEDRTCLTTHAVALANIYAQYKGSERFMASFPPYVVTTQNGTSSNMDDYVRNELAQCKKYGLLDIAKKENYLVREEIPEIKPLPVRLIQLPSTGKKW